MGINKRQKHYDHIKIEGWTQDYRKRLKESKLLGTDLYKRYRASQNKYKSKRSQEVRNDPIRWKKQKELNRLKYYRQRYGNIKNYDFCLNRDKRKCQVCYSEISLTMHHKDGSGNLIPLSERNNLPENLITLCKNCHQNIEGTIKLITRNKDRKNLIIDLLLIKYRNKNLESSKRKRKRID